MLKVCFIYSNRSEISQLTPFIDYFHKKTQTSVIDLSKIIAKIDSDKNLHKIFLKCYKNFSFKKYDYICILGDRRELPFIALAAFFLDIKIVHIGAGEYLEGLPTYDQIIRPVVSILSKYQICSSENAKKEVMKLFSGISNISPNAYSFGNPVFYAMDFKKIKRKIKENYDMVLIHPQSLSRKQTLNDINLVEKKLRDKRTIFILGNKDKNHDLIEKFYRKIRKKNRKYSFFVDLSKKEYFGLVKYCDNFYTNSSSISEIKFLNRKCLRQIGLRNKKRSESELNNNAPKLLFNLLKKKLHVK